MGKEKSDRTRVDTTGAAGALTSNPFAALRELLPEAPAGDAASAPSPVDKPAPAAARSYQVGRTRKGGYPVSLERRAGGKTATILRNVSGDAEALLALLKKRCAAGGGIAGDAIEIQGDQCVRIEAFLREQGL